MWAVLLRLLAFVVNSSRNEKPRYKPGLSFGQYPPLLASVAGGLYRMKYGPTKENGATEVTGSTVPLLPTERHTP